jgi:hypothetical protein
MGSQDRPGQSVFVRILRIRHGHASDWVGSCVITIKRRRDGTSKVSIPNTDSARRDREIEEVAEDSLLPISQLLSSGKLDCHIDHGIFFRRSGFLTLRGRAGRCNPWGRRASGACVRPHRPRKDSAMTSSSRLDGSDARHRSRNRSRARRTIGARARVLHSADGASCRAWPRYEKNGQTSFSNSPLLLDPQGMSRRLLNPSSTVRTSN